MFLQSLPPLSFTIFTLNTNECTIRNLLSYVVLITKLAYQQSLYMPNPVINIVNIDMALKRTFLTTSNTGKD
jgi:hypothetical protein